jgi:hypothetical protein
LEVNTLSGVVDYLTRNPDALNLRDVVVQILSPTVVSLVAAKPNIYRQREQFLKAECTPRQLPYYGKYREIEEFIVELQTYFVPSQVVTEILMLISSIQDDGAVTYTDNGLSQQVTAKTGIVTVGNVKVPNPIRLGPYRTFLEVAQPESLFVLRLRKGKDGDPPVCALFLADGGSWELAAVQLVRTWLVERIPEDVVVLA